MLVPMTWNEVVEGALIRQLVRDHEEAGVLEMADERARLRHSWAGKCARALYYELAGVEGEDMDVPGVWVTSLGRFIHEHWQTAVERDLRADHGEGLTVTPEAKMYIDECASAGHADLFVIGPDGTRVVWELKTINGTGFRNLYKYGPRWSHVIQGALNGYGLAATEVRIVYLAMEAISKPNAAKLGLTASPWERVMTSFVYGADTFYPIAEFEIARWAKLLSQADHGELPAREYVDTGNVVKPIADPTNGPWVCDYCAFRQRCEADFREGR